MDPVSDVIAGLALVVAVLSWIDTRRRVMNAAAHFTLTRALDGRYVLRNTGSVDVVHVEDESGTPIGGYGLKVNESTVIEVQDRYGKPPDSIRVSFLLKPGGRRRERAVRVLDEEPAAQDGRSR